MSGLLSRRDFLTRPARAAEPAPVAPPRDGRPRLAAVGGRCVSAQGVSCRLCLDPCEPAAIRFRLMTGGRAIPEISSQACSGCALCVPVCPVGAITLVPGPAVARM